MLKTGSVRLPPTLEILGGHLVGRLYYSPLGQVLAGLAEAANFQLVVQRPQTFPASQQRNTFFQIGIVRQSYNFAALHAGKVVMMVPEYITQLNFGFPAQSQPVNNAQLLKQVNIAVNCYLVVSIYKSNKFFHS